MAKQRLGYVDIAKAFAIFFVIMGHTGLVYSATQWPGGMPMWMVTFIFTFHMPLFFIMSGYFLKPTLHFDGSYFKKEWTRILRPYVATAVLVILMATIQGFFMADESARVEFVRWLGAALYGEGDTSPVSLVPVERIGAIWFLLALFWAHLFIGLACRTKHPLLWIIGLFLIGSWSGRYVWLPWSIQAGMAAALFVYAGSLMRTHDWFADHRFSPSLWVLFILIWAISGFTFGGISMAMANYPGGLFSIVAGIVGSLCFVVISKGIERHAQPISRFLQWVGRNTLVIFCMHLLEDNIVRYDLVYAALEQAVPGFSWVFVLLGRLALVAAMCGIVYLIPGLNAVYFVGKRKLRRD